MHLNKVRRVHRFVNGHHCTALVRVSVDRQTASKSVHEQHDLKPVKMDALSPSPLSLLAMLSNWYWFHGLRAASLASPAWVTVEANQFVNKSASIFAKISPLIGCTKFPHLPKQSLPI